MTKFIYGISALLVSCVAVLFGQPVSATSPYDSIVHPTDTLILKSYNGVHERDITSSLLANVQTYCNSSYYSSLVSTANNVGGRWAILNLGWWGQIQEVRVIWTTSTSAGTSFSPDGVHYQVQVTQPQKQVVLFVGDNGIIDCEESNITSSSLGIAHSCVPSGCYPSYEVYSSTFPVTYPSGYEGELIPDASDRDLDKDGLSDYIESPNYPNRNAVFCGTSQCAYPDPAKKDVYLEIDWMKNGSTVYKPSSAQIGLVEDMFDAKNINLHVDTGQFGGGNELVAYTANLPNSDRVNEVDAGDYKVGGDGIAANFSANRELIWHYMISGNRYINGDDTAPSTSTGWAEAMGDQLFVAMGVIQDAAGLVSFDRAVANTVAHELGHNLCLGSAKYYMEQPEECVYGGIDNDDVNNPLYNLLNYKSVMNYRYQLTNTDDLGAVDYSDGTNGSGDHNDWAAVMRGLGGFSGERTEINAQRGGAGYIRSPDGTIIE